MRRDQRTRGWLAAARELDNRYLGPATTNNILINTLMLGVRRWTAGLCLVIAGLSLVAAPVLALLGHGRLAIESLVRALCFGSLSLISAAAWKRWGTGTR